MASRSDESKVIETQSACTNVPRPLITVADALAALQAAAVGKDQARMIRRALLAVAEALECEE